MNESRRKLLTQYVGECWHEGRFRCKHCDAADWGSVRNQNRTFTVWPDFGRVAEVLQKKRDWEDFYYYCTQVCDRMLRPYEFTAWLINPARFCDLVGQWLEGK